jgi:hypothetical protein
MSDGIYVIRTSVLSEAVAPEQAVRHYKSVSMVERSSVFFVIQKPSISKVRLIHHRLADRVRDAHQTPVPKSLRLYAESLRQPVQRFVVRVLGQRRRGAWRRILSLRIGLNL